jgi:aerobic carbon-monoxide dehydrogenase medium subunit
MPALHRPRSLEEACELLGTLEEPMIYGGGTAIQILIKQGVLFAEHLVDLALVPGLDALEETAGGLRIGPLVSLRRMERDAAVLRRAPLAADTYSRVANPRVRNTASVGGNIAHGDYRLDPPTALMALDASVELTSTAGTRVVPAREFFIDFQLTAVEPGEIITAILLPDQPAGSSFAYVKLSSLSENDWPSASAAALLVPGGAGARTLRLGLGAVAAVPLFLELEVTGLDVEQAVAAARDAVDPVLDPIPDVRGSETYKRRLGHVAVADAVRQAWRQDQS